MFLLRVPRVTEFLERWGYICRWRAGMMLDLRQLQERPRLPDSYSILPWDPSRLREVAESDYLAYRDTLDADLYSQYLASIPGCERMWREALHGKFGRFDALRSALLVKDGRVCGDVMAAVRSPREAFIGNLAVAPGHRGGTGSALLLHCLWQYKEAGFQRVGLAVTLENHRAYQLYQRLGFVKNGEFPLVARPAGGTQLLKTHGNA
jgi:ribosomal protein S18 acetylase RimI-like enzyme